MKMITNITLVLLTAFSLISPGFNAYAEPVNSPNETIMHIEKAKVEISHRDFFPPSQHIKEARAASEKVTGNPDIVKKATATIIQAQIKVNNGDTKGAIEELNKVLELYKSL
jgi:hypothetical protein